MFPQTREMPPQQRLSFLVGRTGNSPSRRRHIHSPLLRPGNPPRGLHAEVPGNSARGCIGPGQGGSGRVLLAPQATTFRPSSKPRLRPSGRVHAYLLCLSETRLSWRPRGRTDCTGHSVVPKPSFLRGLQPLRPRHLIHAPCSPTPSPSFLSHFAAETTPRSQSRSTHGAGPGALSLPTSRQQGHHPVRPEPPPTRGIPPLLTFGESPHGSASVSVTLQTPVTQRRD